MEEYIFYIGAGIFTLTSGSFFLLKKRNPKIASLNFIVNFVTIASYLVMLSKLLANTATNGELIYWSRWAFYAISCSFLMVEISSILAIDNKTMIEIIVLNVVVMVTGLFASITTDVVKWLFFALSSLAYLLNLYLIFKHRAENNLIVWFVIIFWSGFPLFWLLSPAGFLVLDAFWTALIYLILDLITKVFFGYYTTLTIQKSGATS
jgi:bacteriorhodopsin